MTEPGSRRHEGALAVLARGCARHPWRTVTIWIAVVGILVASVGTWGGTLVDEFRVPDSDAQRAVDLLEQRFPQRSGDAAQVVFAAPDGGVDAAESRAAIERVRTAMDRIPGVSSVGNPYTEEDAAVSDDRRIAYLDVQFDKRTFDIPTSDIDRLQEDAEAAVANSPVQVEFTGDVIASSQGPEQGTSELVGVVAAIIILLIMLGSAVAAGMPILLGLISVGVGMMLLFLAAAVTNFNTITPTLAVMLGLGVGIDYSLFIVTRFRQGIHDGLSPVDAAAVAASTAGRAVVFAGITVAISICSLAVMGLDFITKLGVGAAMTVVTTVLVAITLLPAVLSLLGHRIDYGRLPFLKRRDDSTAAQGSSLVARWASFVTRHAKACAAVALLVIVVLAIPVASVQLGAADAGTNPPNTTTRKAYDLLAEGFGAGFAGPLLITVDQGSDGNAAANLAAALREEPGIDSVSDPNVNDAGDTAIITAYPTTSPQSTETSDLVNHLRDDVVPANLSEGTQAYIGGSTAAFDDLAVRIMDRLPLFLLAIIGITFLLVTMAFRSIVIALKAALTTLCSAFAAFGVLIAVFQWGWLQGVIGLDQTGPIETFVPVIVFSILFGLSMDYEVFLVSRIREEHRLGAPARRAVTRGIGAIGKVVVAAGLIMSLVFLSFLLGDDRIIKEFGLALGAAILIDAFIVRLLLVPAVMHLLNERAWYIPRWLDRVLPRLTIEPPSGQLPEAPARPPRPAPEQT